VGKGESAVLHAKWPEPANSFAVVASRLLEPLSRVRQKSDQLELLLAHGLQV